MASPFQQHWPGHRAGLQRDLSLGSLCCSKPSPHKAPQPWVASRAGSCTQWMKKGMIFPEITSRSNATFMQAPQFLPKKPSSPFHILWAALCAAKNSGIAAFGFTQLPSHDSRRRWDWFSCLFQLFFFLNAFGSIGLKALGAAPGLVAQRRGGAVTLGDCSHCSEDNNSPHTLQTRDNHPLIPPRA